VITDAPTPTPRTSLGYATNLIGGYAREILAARFSGVRAGHRTPHPRLVQPAAREPVFMIPGVLALVLLVVTANLSSMAIVREKELGTLEQLNVTPLGRVELIVGKLVPCAAIGMLDVLLVLAVTIFWFEVPMRGSLLLLLAMSLVYLMTTLGLGLFVSTISGYAAAGDDDDGLLLSDPDGVSLGIRVSDREHAGGDPAADVPHPAPLLHRHPSWDFPERCRTRDVMARCACVVRLGRRHPRPGDAALAQDVELIQ
jgi:hypothetical protein